MTDNIAMTTAPGSSFIVQKTGSTIVSSVTTLNFTNSGNTTVTVTDSGGGVAAINVNSTTATQNLFETIAVSGQSNVVADSSTDTLTLVAGTNISITTNAATDTITINNTSVYGTGFQQTSSNTTSTTTSTTYVNKTTLTTASLTSGTYRIGWYAEIASSSTTVSVDARIQLNGTTDLGFRLQEAKDTRDWYEFSGFYFTSLSGVNTMNMDFRVNPSGATSSIRNARIELWRVS